MAIKIQFDNTHNVVWPTFVLATRSGRKLGSIQASEIQLGDNLNSYFDLNFRVYRYDNGIECRLWDDIKDFKLLWCREWDVWFEIYVEINEESDIVKNVSARSLGEAELSQINLYGIEINTESDIARDDYVPTVLYDADKPEASLLNRILEKAPHYSIKHVDYSITGIQRTFTFDGSTIYDALQEIAQEIDCIAIINSGSNADGSIERSISMYDLESYCTACGHRGTFFGACPECGSEDTLSGYGEDTNIFVSSDNLADGITYAVDTDSVKNCFRLVAGDDLMTATVRNSNPNGSDYIWYISDELKSDMSPELAAKVTEYQQQYEYYKKDYSMQLDAGMLAGYNALVEKYHAYDPNLRTIASPIIGYPALMDAYYDTIDMELYLRDEMMPTAGMQDTTAAQQAALLTARNLSPVAVADVSKCSNATASSAVLAMAKVIVDARYQVKVKDSSFASQTWTGTFTVTNYSDETDTATSARVSITLTDDMEIFVKQKIDKMLDDEADSTTLAPLFKMDEAAFKAEIKKYCLSSLESFHDACQACVDILIQQGIADNETWADSEPNLYRDLYTPYYEKLLALEDEIKVRESELETVAGSYDIDGYLETDGLQTLIEKENAHIQDTLDFEKFVGTELWLEFAAYRREDTYSNDNFISDGLNNRELFDRAREFINVAEEDIFKSATLQHSITATLKNLLVMKEFEPIVDHFAVGNWIRVRVNDDVFRLRLISYVIDFDNLETLSIEFSDVKRVRSGITDSEDIFNQAASMASSFGNVSRQAGQGRKTAQEVNEWVNRGLSLTQMKIIDSADDQNISWDRHGFLCREYLPITDEYDERQLKIINRGLYLTDDNWRTARAGIGNFMYYDPADGQTKEAYGVIADTLIGNLILSEKVGIYNKNNSITLDERGIILTAEEYPEGTDGSVFTVRKKSTDVHGETVYEDVIYMDDEGNAHFKGDVTATSGSFTGDVYAENGVFRGEVYASKGTFNGEVNATSLTIEGEDASDHIRLQARNLSWDSEHSSLTEDGYLTCEGAEIDGTFSWVSEYSSMTKDGKFTCKDATIDGDIVARTLYIGDTDIENYMDGKLTPITTQLSVQEGLIQSKVSSSDVQEMIDNIDIGMRNFFVDSDKFLTEFEGGASDTIWFYTTDDYGLLQSQEMCISYQIMIKDGVFKSGGSSATLHAIFYMPDADQSWHQCSPTLPSIKFTDAPVNCDYRVSFIVKQDGHKLTKNPYLMLWLDGLQSGTVKIGRPMLTIGNKPVDWSLAPEDMVTEPKVESLIEQKADSIRLKASKISWESTYSSMTEDGKLTCTGADISGRVHVEDGWNKIDIATDAWLECKGYWNWARFYEGAITGGEIVYTSGVESLQEHGLINFAATSTDVSTGVVYKGLKLKGDCIRLQANLFAVTENNSESETAIYGGSGSLKFCTNLHENSNGGLSWTNYTLKFQNGVMITNI